MVSTTPIPPTRPPNPIAPSSADCSFDFGMCGYTVDPTDNAGYRWLNQPGSFPTGEYYCGSTMVDNKPPNLFAPAMVQYLWVKLIK